MATIIASSERNDDRTPLLLAEKGGPGSALYTYDVADVYNIPDLKFQAEVHVEPLRYSRCASRFTTVHTRGLPAVAWSF